MFSLHRWRDRLFDRRPIIRISRSRRRSPWWLIALLIAVMTLIVLVVGWWQMTAAPRGHVAVISTSNSGEHRLDGRPVSLGELETELARVKAGEEPLLVAISGPSLDGPPAQPSPEVAALLARLRLNWMSAPQVGLAVPPPPQAEGGDYGR